MFGYRVILDKRILWIVLVVVSLICRPSHAQVPDALPLDDPNAVVQSVLSALKAMKLPTTGRGTAIMKTENYRKPLDDRELIVDFAFTEQTSRTDIFESSGGITGSRLFARVVSDKHVVTLYQQSVDIYGFGNRRDIGLDFHPEVFMQFNGYPLTERLEGILKHAKRPENHTSVELDDKGVLHIVSGGPVTSPKVVSFECQMSFDTKRGLIPVLLRSTTETPEGTTSAIVRLEWAQYDLAWYVSRAEYVLQPGNRFHRVVTIESFTPDADEKDFILDWLDVPDGMSVSGAGKMRWYKSPFRPAEDPEIPLEETDFVQKIREQQSSVTSQVEVDDAGSVSANGFYLRDYQTGRLIGPLSLKPGSLLPPLDKKTYIIADPTESELKIRKLLLETHTYENRYLDYGLADVVEDVNRMLKSRLGDKAPPVRIETAEESWLPLITMKLTEVSAYETLCNIAAKAKVRIFVEDGAVVLSRKKLREMSGERQTAMNNSPAG